MKLNDVVTFALFVTLNVSATVGLAAELESPMIKGHGSTVEIPNGKYPPQANARVVLDVTSGERTGGVLKALDKAALIINLYSDAKAGVDQGFKMVIVLHGS
ncbi:MAG: hypothetical protein KDB23_20360, partial [Planctomycetales bacterium]|nr:hypothetical protein [Planctomycetales bacterium]